MRKLWHRFFERVFGYRWVYVKCADGELFCRKARTDPWGEVSCYRRPSSICGRIELFPDGTAKGNYDECRWCYAYPYPHEIVAARMTQGDNAPYRKK